MKPKLNVLHACDLPRLMRYLMLQTVSAEEDALALEACQAPAETLVLGRKADNPAQPDWDTVGDEPQRAAHRVMILHKLTSPRQVKAARLRREMAISNTTYEHVKGHLRRTLWCASIGHASVSS